MSSLIVSEAFEKQPLMNIHAPRSEGPKASETEKRDSQKSFSGVASSETKSAPRVDGRAALILGARRRSLLTGWM